VFPQLKDIAIEASWAGQIAVTPEMMPHLHEPDSGIIAALGLAGAALR
jgi:glycine/D-amino acid oxidase-like deaminating enzyme